MQAFDAVLAFFGIQWLTPIIGLAVVSASCRLPHLAVRPVEEPPTRLGKAEYMPPWFQQTNEVGVP